MERVAPVEGAQRVDFDYDAADAALTWARSTLPGVAQEQVGALDAAVEAVRVDWEGTFRRELDRAAASLRARLGGLAGSELGAGDVTVAYAVHNAVAEANRRQREYNRLAVEAAEREAERQAEEAAEETGTG